MECCARLLCIAKYRVSRRHYYCTYRTLLYMLALLKWVRILEVCPYAYVLNGFKCFKTSFLLQ